MIILFIVSFVLLVLFMFFPYFGISSKFLVKREKSIKSFFVVLLVVCSFGTLELYHASAADDDTPQDVLDNTRYSAIGFGFVSDIINFIDGVVSGELSDGVLGNPDSLIGKFASTVANDAYNDLHQYAIDSTTGYQIKDIYAMMAKRKIVYPVNGYEETQYLYVYQNLNVGASPQQFGNYTIAPNTLFMVRQTNFSGVLAYSIPLSENSIDLSFGNSSRPLGIVLPANQNFKMYTESGIETFVLPQGVTVFVENNTINSIVNDHLQAVYDYDIAHNRNYYEDYLPDGYMDGLEALMGVGITYNYSDWTTDWTGYGGDGTNQNPWYVTGFFSNNDRGTGSPSYYSTNFNINPALPPAYIMSPDNPLYSGKVINNETINNYNDYGMTIVDGTLEIDPDILAGALGGLIDPDFNGALGGVFGGQPSIGLDFNNPLDFNYPDLIDDYLQSLVVYPPSEYPMVEPLTTADIVIRPVFPVSTEALPSYLPSTAANIYSVADRFLSPELLPLYLALALFGLCIAILL